MRKLNPAAWSAAATAVVLLSWMPPLALTVGALIILIAWANGEKIPSEVRTKTKAKISPFTGEVIEQPTMTISQRLRVVEPKPSSRGMRTSRLTMIFRLFLLVFGILVGIIGILAIGGLTIISLPFAALAAVITVTIYVVFGWTTQVPIMDYLFRGKNADYDAFRDSGGDPFFDQMIPPLINNDPDDIRTTGRKEVDFDPEYVKQMQALQSGGPLKVQPDPSWNCVCSHCGVSVPDMERGCWNCGQNWGRTPWNFGCGRCGARVRGAKSTCWYCGTRGMVPGDGTTSIHQQGNKKRKRR